MDGIEALSALERWGTVSEAASHLRVTQSAVSKRLMALREAVGFAVVVSSGRRLEITPEGLDLLERARPLLAELQDLALPTDVRSPTTFSLALSDSIAASFGPFVVADALQQLPDVRIELHAHRSVLLIESVRLGRYQMGLSTDLPTPLDLLHVPLIEEPMVLVSPDKILSLSSERPLITIEPGAATWRATLSQMRRHHSELLARTRIPVESYSAALQMVRAGFGDGLVPLGLVLQSEIPPERFRIFSDLRRPISLLTRKTVHQLARFGALRDALARATAQWFSSRTHATGIEQQELS